MRFYSSTHFTLKKKKILKLICVQINVACLKTTIKLTWCYSEIKIFIEYRQRKSLHCVNVTGWARGVQDGLLHRTQRSHNVSYTHTMRGKTYARLCFTNGRVDVFICFEQENVDRLLLIFIVVTCIVYNAGLTVSEVVD